MPKIAIPAKVSIPGYNDVTRIVTGYVGKNSVAVEVDGHVQIVPKDQVPPEVHAKLNEEL